MQQPTVLVVEDDPGLNQLLVLALRGDGFSVVSAANGEDALAVFRHGGRIDLLLTDFQLGGGMNGLQLASLIVSENASMKVLVISGTPGCEGLAQTQGWPFRSKPLSVASLLEQVRQIMTTGAVPASLASRPRSPQSPGTAQRRKPSVLAGGCREGRERGLAGRRRSGRRGGAAA
jgi:CheY-like chemotaxis protein